MTKANKPESRKSGANPPKAAEVKTPGGQQTQVNKDQPAAGKSRQAGKGDKSRIGGTAVPGAKSTLPREINTASPAQQQAESYSRMMRRRMQHMGMGPYGQGPADVARSRRQKRVEKRKQRQEEVKKTVVTKGPSTNIKLGRRNTYFVLGTLALIILIIVIAIIIRYLF